MHPNIVRPVKLTPPTMPRLWARHDLRERLDALGDASGIWIHGPAGAGKTSAVIDWLRHRNGPFQWYRVDGSDRDPAVLFHQLARGTDLERPGGSALPQFDASLQADPVAFARQFVEDYLAAAPPGALLVFDDAHEVDADEIWSSVLAAFVERAPDKRQIVIVSRASPPAAFARLQVSNRLGDIDAAALMVPAANLRAYAEFCWNVELDERQGQRLHAITHGWPVAVQLLGPEDLEREGVRLRSGDDSAVNYIDREIYAASTDDERAVLRWAAHLDSIPASALVHSSAPSGGGSVLDALARRGVLVSRAELPAPAYVLHPILREFVRARARSELEPVAYDDLLARAAEAATACEQWTRAVELHRERGAPDSIVALVIDHAPRLLAAARSGELEAWLSALDPVRVAADRRLTLYRGFVRAPQDPPAAIRDFERVIELSPGPGLDGWGGLASAAAIQAIVHLGHDLRAAAPWIERLEGWTFGMAADIDIRVHEARMIALMLTPVPARLREPWTREVRQWIEAHPGVMSPPLAMLCLYHAVRGEIPQADFAYQYAFRTGPAELDLRDQLVVETFCSTRALMAHDPQAAMRHCDRGIELGERWGANAWRNLMLPAGVHTALDIGDLELAETYLHRMAQLHERSASTWTAGNLAYYRAFANLSRGELDAAWAGFTKAKLIADTLHYPIAQGATRCCAALVAFVRGDLDTLDIVLGEALVFAEQTGHPVMHFMVHGLRALWLEARDAPPHEIRAHAQAAMNAADAHGCHVGTAWHPPTMARICAHALRGPGPHESTIRLIRVRGLRPPEGSKAPPQWPFEVHVQVMNGFHVQSHFVESAGSGTILRESSAPATLLEVLVALGGSRVPEDRILANLPSEGRTDDRAWIDSNVARLRKALGERATIECERRSLSLSSSLCGVDLWSYHSRLLDIRADAGEGALELGFRSLVELSHLVPFAHRVGHDLACFQTARTRWRLALLDTAESLRDRARSSGAFELGEAIEHWSREFRARSR